MKRENLNFLMIPLFLLSTSCSNKYTRSNPKPGLLHLTSVKADSIMAEKFVFLYFILTIEEDQYIEDLTSVLRRSESEIRFMEELTGIQSTYPADRLGRLFVREKDYIEWTYWYFENSKYLVWDDSLNKIVIKKP